MPALSVYINTYQAGCIQRRML